MKSLFLFTLRAYAVICMILVTVTFIWLLPNVIAILRSSVQPTDRMAESIGLYALNEGPKARGPHFGNAVGYMIQYCKDHSVDSERMIAILGPPSSVQGELGGEAFANYQYTAPSGQAMVATADISKGFIFQIGFNTLEGFNAHRR